MAEEPAAVAGAPVGTPYKAVTRAAADRWQRQRVFTRSRLAGHGHRHHPPPAGNDRQSWASSATPDTDEADRLGFPITGTKKETRSGADRLKITSQQRNEAVYDTNIWQRRLFFQMLYTRKHRSVIFEQRSPHNL